jgi:hypothetical protein
MFKRDNSNWQVFNNKEAIGEGTRTKYKDITSMKINYIKTKKQNNNFGMKTLKVDFPTLTKHAKPCLRMDNVHAIMEMEH